MPTRLLVIDASLAKRLATELNARGRQAKSVAELLNGDNPLDPVLIQRLRNELHGRDWVLVTGDDNMPEQHPDAVQGLTVATVDPDWEGKWPSQEGWKRESVHRWAHYLDDRQPAGSIRRLSPSVHRTWTPKHAGD